MNDFDYILILFFVTISTIGIFYILYETFKHKKFKTVKAMKYKSSLNKTANLVQNNNTFLDKEEEPIIVASKNNIGEKKRLLDAREFYRKQQEKRYRNIIREVAI